VALCAASFGKAQSKDGHAAGGHVEHDGWLVRGSSAATNRRCGASVRNRGLVLGGAGTLTVASLMLMSTFGTSFLPAFKEGTFTVFLLAPPGTSLGEQPPGGGCREAVRGHRGRVERDAAHGAGRAR
jgi:multidrug efflux pump subunit AcrB